MYDKQIYFYIVEQNQFKVCYICTAVFVDKSPIYRAQKKTFSKDPFLFTYNFDIIDRK